MESHAIHPAPLLSFRFAAAYAVTMRPYLLFVSGMTGICGLALARPVGTGHTLLIALASFLAYGFGQALTDCFQTDTDALSAPYRPLPRGEIRGRDVLLVSLFGLASCVAVFVSTSAATIGAGLLGVLGLATYTWFKRRWWGGPWYNALVVVILFAMAGMSADGSPGFLSRDGVACGGTAAFLGYANFVLAGYFKDISADAATGYRTVPVAFGRRPAALASDLLAGTFLAASLIATQARSLPALLLWTAAATLSVAGQIQLHRVRSDHEAHGPICLTVHAYLLGLAAVAASARPEWLVPLLAFYGAFMLTLARRPALTQI
jgi:4-hydroxybenzoate polyprenyltransferase